MTFANRISARLLTRLWIPAMAVLAVAFGVLQYHWLDELSARDRESRQHHLAADVRRFGEDFDAELSRAYFAFQLNAESIERRDGSDAADRLDAWKKRARYPRLVRDIWIAEPVMSSPPGAASLAIEANGAPSGIFGAAGSFDVFVPRGGSKRLFGRARSHDADVKLHRHPATPTSWRFLHLDAGTRRFVEATLPAELSSLRQRFKAMHGPPDEPGGEFLNPFANPIDEGTLSILVPAIVEMPVPRPPENLPEGAGMARTISAVEPWTGFVIVQLDRDCIVGELLPELSRKYFALSTGSPDFEYHVTVVRGRPPHATVFATASKQHLAVTAGVDASSNLLATRWPMPFPGPGKFAVFSGGVGVAAEVAADLAPGIAPRVAAGVPATAIMANEVEPANVVNTFFRPPAPDGWQLRVTHRAGSLEALASQTRRQNILVSAVILVLLMGSFVIVLLALRRARELTRQQLEFVAGVSHELRTPVAVVCMTGANLADGLVSDPQQIRHYGRLIQREGRRLTEMTEHVLSFARIESDALPASEIVAADTLAKRAMESMQPHMDELGFTCQLVSDEPSPQVEVDRASIERVIQNLLNNAIKYVADRRELRISVGTERVQERNWVCVAVEDQGIGIHPDELMLIFEPFRRGREAIERNLPGTGLGLSLVRRIMHAHGGDVRVRSAVGAGSIFTIVLPMVEPRS